MDAAQTRALMAAVSTEFASIGEGIEGLSALVSEHVRLVDADCRDAVLRQAQAIDDLTQRCDALRGLMQALAQGDTLRAAMAEMPLADLALRLSETQAQARPRPVSGDLMLFD